MNFRAILLLLVFLGGVSTAHAAIAAEYEVRVCNSSFGHAAFVASTNSPQTMILTAQCPPGGQGMTAAAGSVNSEPGATAAWSLSAPIGASIRQINLRRMLSVNGQYWAVTVRADSQVLERCERPPGQVECTLGIEQGSLPTTSYHDLNARRVSFSVSCENPPTTCSGRTPSRAWIIVSNATAHIDDPAAPTIQPPTGSLLDPGWHSGTGRLAASSTDASGIKSLAIAAGGVALGSRDGSCDYSRMRPCAGTLTASYEVDTARLGDGTHEVRVTATDAADQTSTATATLRVDGTAPAAPTELAVERNPDGTLVFFWTNPDQGTASPITSARYEVCSALGVGCVAGPVTNGAGVSRIDSVGLASGNHVVKIWLQDEAGNVDPANAATLEVDPSKVTARAVNTQPPVLDDEQTPSSRLKIRRARRSGSTLTVSGTIARAASARIEAQVSRSKSGRPVAAKAHVKPKRGKWTARVKLPASLRTRKTLYIAVKYRGQSKYRATTLRRQLTAKSAGRGQASGEFSIKSRSGRR